MLNLEHSTALQMLDAPMDSPGLPRTTSASSRTISTLTTSAGAAANESRAGAGAPSSLHLWWGNRQLAIARALVFAQLVDAPPFEDIEKTRRVQGVFAGLLEGDPLAEPVARVEIKVDIHADSAKPFDKNAVIRPVTTNCAAIGFEDAGFEI